MTLPRPKHHFSTPKNWMNDPNGLIFHEGIYHLYFQHHPYTPYFGHISWGHATSTDLKRWKHQPIALHAYDDVKIYSGCVIFDRENVLRQPEPSLVAIYTEHIGDETNYHERICLAISADNGKTFDQVNRLIILERDDPDFRDPKVIYHRISKKWIMLVALPKAYTICFYSSVDLKQWVHESDFTSIASHTQFWECPNLFPMINEQGKKHWALSISGSNYDGKTWGMFYFIGQFDGSTFSTEEPLQWLDYGRDFYAGITFDGTGSEKIMMAWCNNWLTANEPHNRDWSGIMSSPRKLSLRGAQLYHELITDIEPVTIDVSTTKEVYLNLNKGQITIDRSSIRILIDGQVIEERTFPFDLQEVQLYEDYDLIELLFNNGVSGTWLLP